MTKNMTATKAKNNFGTLLDEVYAKGNTIVIVKNSKPVAKVSPIFSYNDTPEKETLTLKDAEYKKVKKGMKEFRETFKFTF